MRPGLHGVGRRCVWDEESLSDETVQLQVHLHPPPSRVHCVLQARPLTPCIEQATSGMAPSREGADKAFSMQHSCQIFEQDNCGDIFSTAPGTMCWLDVRKRMDFIGAATT